MTKVVDLEVLTDESIGSLSTHFLETRTATEEKISFQFLSCKKFCIINLVDNYWACFFVYGFQLAVSF